MSEIIVPAPRELLLDRLRLTSPAQVNRSVWTGTRKVVGLAGGELWSGQATIADIATEEEEQQWRAFLFALRGPQNWFRWLLPCHRHIGPKPAVASGAVAGYSLPLTGIQPNTRILRAGQFMTVPMPLGNARTVVLTSDLRGDGAGNATASFEPALPQAAAQGATVETTNPFIPMALNDPTQGFALSAGISQATFEVEEAR